MAHKAVQQSGKIAPYEITPIEAIPSIAAKLRDTFWTNKTKDVQYRLVQLRKLYWGIVDCTPQLREALMLDLKKSPHDAHVSEIDWTLGDCLNAIKNLEKWVKDDKDIDIALSFSMLKPRIKKEPFGAVLIIGTYNFPVQLNMCPFIGAIAAGCTAVLKPSESSPATAMVLTEIVEKYLDPSAYTTVNGRVPETTALLEEKWEKIFYTGGVNVAKIISKKAAETLTPVCLELGGKNPAFVTKNADIRLAARRLMWSKTVNAGQVCISQNYVLCHRDVVDSLINMMNVTYDDFFPKGAKVSPDYARVVNVQQFDRLKAMLDNTNGKIVLGGDMDRDDLYIGPTVVLVDSAEDRMIQEESFGPIWAILPYDDLDAAINTVRKVDYTPLSLMTFGSKSENEKVLNSITSGGATINDGFMHAAVNTLPFGGVGQSGTGSYRGKHSFDCFTHRRTVVETPLWMDSLLRVRYMPFRQADLKQFQWMNGSKPDFDRSGKRIRGLGYWLWMVVGLGSPSVKGALFKWLFVLAGSYLALNGPQQSLANLREMIGF
ncbi:Beta-apo-4'-carotenal oxygenase [Apiospora saccharicola]|uniref:Aldehyde dehydrogenase n=1 Tax=Apiospora saccharicola TaxID=335842 RepID=A0ABR1WEN1_9PEZI